MRVRLLKSSLILVLLQIYSFHYSSARTFDNSRNSSDIEENVFARLDAIEKQAEGSRKPTDIMLYRGQFSDTDLKHILLNASTDYKPSFITVASLSQPLEEEFLGFYMKGEGQLAHHTGIMKHLEFNGLLVFRSPRLLRALPLHFAFGEGLSLASRNPDLENRRKSALNPNVESEYSRNLLNYLMFELELGLPMDSYQPRAFVRIHHRSGIYGIMCPPTCGSNYVAYGVKFAY